jgi:hypothetical protein
MLGRIPLLALALLAAPAAAAEPPLDARGLTDALKPMLLASLPTPLAVAPMSWGEQREVTIGIRWERERLLFKPLPMRAVKNDGHWQKVTLTAVDPAKSLALHVRDVRVAADKTIFNAAVGMDVRAVYEQQMWAMGKRVYAGETHVRCRAVLDLKCELTSSTTFEPGAKLPTVTIRVRGTEARAGYSDFVCEHTLGMNGKPAEVLGKAAFEVVKKVAPQVERDLLAKANAAALKAAETKEVRLEFDKLLAKPAK